MVLLFQVGCSILLSNTTSDPIGLSDRWIDGQPPIHSLRLTCYYCDLHVRLPGKFTYCNRRAGRIISFLKILSIDTVHFLEVTHVFQIHCRIHDCDESNPSNARVVLMLSSTFRVSISIFSLFQIARSVDASDLT